MRYSPKRNYLYPVMRPYADDYGDSNEFKAVLREPSVDTANDLLLVSLDYEITPGSVLESVRSGDAVCVAMFYCATTLYRTLLRGAPGECSVSGQIPLSAVYDQIEIHPSIVAMRDFEYKPVDVHEEYSLDVFDIKKGQPLATDETWHFRLHNNQPAPAESIFTLARNDDVDAGLLRANVDIAERYIRLEADSETYAMIKSYREHDVNTAIVSLYLGPLMEGLRLLVDDDAEQIWPDHSWAATLQSKLSQLGLVLTYDSNLFEVAQRLLELPYDRLTVYESDSKDNSQVLRILSEEGYKSLFELAHDKPEGFIDGFNEGSNWLESELRESVETSIWSGSRRLHRSIDELNEIDKDGPDADYEHSKILCEALGPLSPTDYSDGLLWASLNCFNLAKYASVRWKYVYRKSKAHSNERASKASFVNSHWLEYTSDSRRANASARLFWLNELSRRISAHSDVFDDDEMLKFLSGNVNVYHQILSRPYLIANSVLMAKVCEAIKMSGDDYFKQTKTLSDWLAGINTRAGAQSLDMLDDDEIESLVRESQPPKDR